MNKYFLLTFFLIALGLFVFLYFDQQKPFKNVKNVILISIDSLGVTHLSEYGYKLQTTPHLNEFFHESYVYLHAVSPSSWTLPSHMSIFTSMYPSEHKLVNTFSSFNERDKTVVTANLKQLSPSTMTLAEILKQNGYTTGAFTGDSGVGHQYGFGQGFDTYFDGIKYGGFNSIVPKALEWLETNRNKNIFLFLHGYDVNEQYTPPGGLDFRYADTKPAGGSLSLNQLTQQRRALYDERINRADNEFQNFMNGIQRLRLMDNTLIIVFSDHGLEYYEHKQLGAGNSLYGELVDVPLAIHLPGQTEGKILNSLVSTLDIMPTVLQILNIQSPVPGQIKGIDLASGFGNDDISRNIFMETDFKLSTHKRAIQTPDGWKFILTMNGPEKELYDLKRDPGEQENLLDQEPEKALELEQLVRSHLKDMNAADGPWDLGCPPEFSDQCR